MSNTKISALTSATTPLAGTEVLPIVQSSATVKVATNDLTVRNVRANATTGILQVTGPAAASTRVMTTPDANFTVARTDAAQSFTGDQTLSTGNLIQGTAGKGINFTANTPASGMTSQLLNWYEEGTFSPTVIGTVTAGTVTYNSRYGRYTRVGRLVTFEIYLYWVSGTGTGFLRFGGLPFASASSNTYPSITVGSFYALTFNVGTYLSAAITGNSTTTIDLFNCPTGGVAVTPGSVAYNASGAIQLTGSYSI